MDDDLPLADHQVDSVAVGVLDERHDGLARAVGVAGGGRGGCRRTRQPDGAGRPDPCRSEELPSAGVTHLVLHIGTRTSSVTYATGVSAPGGFRIGARSAGRSWRVRSGRRSVARMRTTSPHPVRLLAAAAVTALCAGLGVGLAAPTKASPPGEGKVDKDVRFATFNASLNRTSEGELVARPVDARQRQAANVAETIQRVGPDVLLINEFDYDAGDEAADAVPRQLPGGAAERGARRSTTPTPTSRRRTRACRRGFDLNNNGDASAGDADDAYGIRCLRGPVRDGRLLEVPDRRRRVRTFQNFLWKDMPGALLPDDPATPRRRTGTHPRSWTCCGCRQVATGTSRSRSAGKTVHFLVSHPTPPAFDGAEDRNGTAQLRRDPASGPTTSRPARGPLHLRRRRARTVGLRKGAPLRDRRRPELRPARRRLASPARPSSCSSTHVSTRRDRRRARARSRRPRCRAA